MRVSPQHLRRCLARSPHELCCVQLLSRGVARVRSSVTRSCLRPTRPRMSRSRGTRSSSSSWWSETRLLRLADVPLQASRRKAAANPSASKAWATGAQPRAALSTATLA